MRRQKRQFERQNCEIKRPTQIVEPQQISVVHYHYIVEQEKIEKQDETDSVILLMLLGLIILAVFYFKKFVSNGN